MCSFRAVWLNFMLRMVELLKRRRCSMKCLREVLSHGIPCFWGALGVEMSMEHGRYLRICRRGTWSRGLRRLLDARKMGGRKKPYACSARCKEEMLSLIHSCVFEHFTYSKKPILVTLKNSLIHMYASCGEIDAAFAVFERDGADMITAFAKHGYANEALSVFQWMQSASSEHTTPDEITFLGLLCACSHDGYITNIV